MKLTSFLLFITLLQVSAKGFSQINLKENNAPFSQVLKSIEKQSGYLFVYNARQIESGTITADLKNATLEETLKTIFKDKPITYEIVDKNIVLLPKKEEPGFLDKIKSVFNPPPLEISGRVLNEKNEPLSGASVVVKRTKSGTLTDANGEFKIGGVTSKDTLVFSYIGYVTQSIPIGTQIRIFPRLEETTNKLDQIIIQAYGTTTQRTATGDIGKVTSKEIEQQPVMNFIDALQGKIAGLNVTETNGYASAPVKVELRGRALLNSNFPSDPLYVIDGVPLNVLPTPNASNYAQGSPGFAEALSGPANGQSPLFSINPADIESIEVLKDADATAIYGSRGANGVILITTKKGTAGKTKLNVNVQEGVQKVTRYFDLMNTQQYLAMRKEAFKNDNIDYTSAANIGKAYDLVSWDQNSYTNWQRQLYGGTGQDINTQASLSGGNAQTTFRIGAGYDHVTNILTVSGADQRGSASFNLSHSSNNQKLHIGLSAQYNFTQSDMVSLPGKVNYAPNAPSIYDANGNLNYAGWGGQNSAARSAFPFANLKDPYTSKTNFVNSMLDISFEPIKGLKLITDFGYNIAQADQQYFQTIASQDPLSNPSGTSYFGDNKNNNLSVEPQINYNALLGKGKLSVLLGSSIQQTNTSGFLTAGSGYTSDLLLQNIGSASAVGGANYIAEYRYAALFARVTYNYNSEYIVNLTARRDGSSRFGDGYQFGNFGSVGAAWIFTEESWAKENLPFLSFGKLRSSYGLTGDDGVGDYGYLSRWQPQGGAKGQSYLGLSTLDPTQFANPNFHWATNKKFEGALDLGFLRDRITISIDYYLNRIGDQLVQLPTPALSGFTSVTANSPALVQNAGWEFSGNAKIVDTKKFSFAMNFNASFNRNKLVAYPNFNLSPYLGQYVINQPLNIVKLLHYTGVDPQTGLYTFQDLNHDGQIINNFSNLSANDDRNLVNLNPTFFGGVGMNFSYSGFQLSLFFNVVKQIGKNALYGIAPGTLNTNEPVSVLNEWQKPGDLATIARFSTTNSATQDGYFRNFSDGIYTDASFIRLSNLSLSYNLPSAFIKKFGLQGCSIFCHANNLFVLTNYNGPDPETQNYGGLPPTRTIVAGLNLNF